MADLIDGMASQLFRCVSDEGFPTPKISALNAEDVRAIVREHAEALLAAMKKVPVDSIQSYEDLVAVTARLLVTECPAALCRVVEFGIGTKPWVVDLMEWKRIVQVGCEVIELTRDAWPDGFLQMIVRDELRPFVEAAEGRP